MCMPGVYFVVNFRHILYNWWVLYISVKVLPTHLILPDCSYWLRRSHSSTKSSKYLKSTADLPCKSLLSLIFMCSVPGSNAYFRPMFWTAFGQTLTCPALNTHARYIYQNKEEANGIYNAHLENWSYSADFSIFWQESPSRELTLEGTREWVNEAAWKQKRVWRLSVIWGYGQQRSNLGYAAKGIHDKFTIYTTKGSQQNREEPWQDIEKNQPIWT